MRRALLVASVIAFSAPSISAQTAPQTAAPAPIIVAEEAPPGSSMSPAMGIGSGAAAIVVLGIGLIIACGIACAQ